MYILRLNSNVDGIVLIKCLNQIKLSKNNYTLIPPLLNFSPGIMYVPSDFIIRTFIPGLNQTDGEGAHLKDF